MRFYPLFDMARDFWIGSLAAPNFARSANDFPKNQPWHVISFRRKRNGINPKRIHLDDARAIHNRLVGDTLAGFDVGLIVVNAYGKWGDNAVSRAGGDGEGIEFAFKRQAQADDGTGVDGGAVSRLIGKIERIRFAASELT